MSENVKNEYGVVPGTGSQGGPAGGPVVWEKKFYRLQTGKQSKHRYTLTRGKRERVAKEEKGH